MLKSVNQDAINTATELINTATEYIKIMTSLKAQACDKFILIAPNGCALNQFDNNRAVANPVIIKPFLFTESIASEMKNRNPELILLPATLYIENMIAEKQSVISIVENLNIT